MEAELEAERQGAEEEQQRAREAIERQKAELQKLEEQRRAQVTAPEVVWVFSAAALDRHSMVSKVTNARGDSLHPNAGARNADGCQPACHSFSTPKLVVSR